MNVHIHIGPANHQKILLNQLRVNGFKHSWTNFYPHFEYRRYTKDSGSIIYPVRQNYDLIDKVVLGLRSKVSQLRKTNWHMDVSFPVYDRAAAKIIKGPTLLFAWPMVSKNIIKKVNDSSGITVLDYPIAHISCWQKTLQEEANLYQSSKTPRSQFTNRMWKYMLQEIEEAQYINVPSKFVWDSFIQNGVHENKLLLNNYGVDASLFYPTTLKNDKFTIVYVGSVELRKGVHYLIEAFKKLKLGNAEVKIIGDIKDDFKSCFPEFFKEKDIKWMGYCSPEKTAEELRHSHILVMPSIMEGLSLTILEAQACGLPVIASENTGARDIIIDGSNGFVFPNRDVDSLCNYILQLYKDRDLLNKMSENSRKVFNSHFTAEAYGKRIIKLFDDLIPGTSKLV